MLRCAIVCLSCHDELECKQLDHHGIHFLLHVPAALGPQTKTALAQYGQLDLYVNVASDAEDNAGMMVIGMHAVASSALHLMTCSTPFAAAHHTCGISPSLYAQHCLQQLNFSLHAKPGAVA
jgi:hypothetical protein